MPKIPCPVNANCPPNGNLDFEMPTFGYNTEAPDLATFCAIDDGNFIGPPPLNSSWSNPSVPGMACSTLSQQDANNQAANANLINTNNGIIPAGATGPAPLFANDQQQETILCPGGIPFTWTLPPGEIISTSKALANQVAQSLAVNLATQEAICLSGLSVSAYGLNEAVNSLITVTNATSNPIVFAVVSGALPPGTVLVPNPGPANPSVSIVGTASQSGSFTFTIQATNPDGTFMNQTYTITVLGITNLASLTNPGIGFAYSFQIQSSFGTAPFTYQLTGGSLPAGLSLSSSGLISGIPTHNASSVITVQVTDGLNNQASASASIGCACDSTAFWSARPGNCRLQIQGYNSTFFGVCAGCVTGGSVDWDGNFSVFNTPANVPVYSSNPAQNRINTKQLGVLGGIGQAQCFFDTGGANKWEVSILCQNGTQLWQGHTANGPLGVYTAEVDCGGSTPSLTVVAYNT